MPSSRSGSLAFGSAAQRRGSRVVAVVAFLLVAVFARPIAAQEVVAETAEASTAEVLQRIDRTLARIAQLLERSTELDRAALALRRLERAEDRLDVARSEAKRRREEREQLESEILMMAERAEVVEREVGFDPPEEHEARMLEEMGFHRQRLEGRREQLDQEIALAEQQRAEAEAAVEEWRAVLGETLDDLR